MVAKVRGYLVGGDCAGAVEPVGKVVVALAPDTVDVTDGGVRINQHLVPNSKPLTRDRRGRPLTWWQDGPAALKPGQIFLLSTLRPSSFDSRYFGPVCMSEVRSVVRSLLITDRISQGLALVHRHP
jgi:conjugative transfer signal peptidase TraF